MILTDEELSPFIEESKNLSLKLIDGVLIAHDKYKVDVLSYILNMYPQFHELRFFWHSEYGPEKRGVLYVSKTTWPNPVATVIVKNNKVLFIMDDFTFEDDKLAYYVLNCTKKDSREIIIKTALFGDQYFKYSSGENNVMLLYPKYGKRDSDFNKFPFFKTRKYLKINNNNTQYTINRCHTDIEALSNKKIEKLRLQFSQKIDDVYRRCSVSPHIFQTMINVTTGRFNFNVSYFLTTEEQRKFLEYIHENHKKLDNPLFHSILGVAEDFLSEQYHGKVCINNKAVIKNYLDVQNMVSIC